jgi:hypothetical protein
MDKHVNGGKPRSLMDRPGIPMGTWFLSEWPSTEDIKQKNPDSCVLRDPDPFTHQIEYPISVSFYEDMQQEDFWASVRTYGHKLFYYRSLKVGTRYQFAPPEEGGGFMPQIELPPKRGGIRYYHY